MNEFYDFVLRGLDLSNKIILDAAVGTGEATYSWAKKVHEQGGTSEIISIDIDLPEIQKEKIKVKLGEYAKYVELREADIFNLTFLKDSSIDIINCDDTIIFLNIKPLRLLQALKEFTRVLKPGGHLIITSEITIEGLSDPENEAQWRRWNLAKAIYDLKGETWSSEPLPEDVKSALQLLGFEVYAEKTFAGGKNYQYQDCITEWCKIMLEKVRELPWSTVFRYTLIKEINEIFNKVLKDGYLVNPSLFVLKCRKRATI